MIRPTPACFLLSFLLIPAAAVATPPCPPESPWEAGGTRVTSPAAIPQKMIAVPGSGGARIFWSDFRSQGEVTLYSRHVTSFAWQGQGEQRLTPVATGKEEPPSFALAPDGSLFAVWADDRNDDGDIFVQRIAFGRGERSPSFPPEGIAVCRAAGRQSEPTVALDGAGGFYVAWITGAGIGAPTGADIYIQRFHDYGQVWEGWPANGVALCTSPGDQLEPVVIADGSGGALVVFLDLADPFDRNLSMARISGSGAVPSGWENGKAISGSPADEAGPIVLPIETGGALVGWSEVTVRGANPAMGIRLTRLTGAGEAAPGWSLEGLPIAEVDGVTGYPSLASDGAGGAFAGWVEKRTGGAPEARATHVAADGAVAPGWPAGGRVLGGSLEITGIVALSGDTGGVIAAWVDPGGDGDLRALRLDGAGSVARFWPSEGVVVREGTYPTLGTIGPGLPPGGAIASDGSGGALVFWSEARDLSPALWAQGISRNGVVAPQTLRFGCGGVDRWITRLYPMPTGGPLTIEAFAPDERPLRFEIYDVRGRLRQVTRLPGAPGPALLPFGLDLSSLEPGVYFVRYAGSSSSGVARASRRVVVAR